MFLNSCIQKIHDGEPTMLIEPAYAVAVCGQYVGTVHGSLDDAKKFAIDNLDTAVQKAEAAIARYREWKSANAG